MGWSHNFNLKSQNLRMGMQIKQIQKLSKVLYAFIKCKYKAQMGERKYRKYQLKKLKKITNLAYANIPFYTAKWNQAGFHPSMLKTLEDINKIPILTKDELRSEYLKGLDTSNWKDGRWLATTGSTGAYVNLFQPSSKINRELAVMSPLFASTFFKRKISKGLMFLVIEEDSYEAMGGFELPNPKVRFEDVFTPLVEMVKIIKEFKPDVIVTYPSRLKELISYMEDNQINNVNVPTILTSGEKLDEVTRHKAIKMFHGSIHEAYAVTEVGVIALESPDNNGLKVLDWKIYVEVCDDHGVALKENNQLGNIIVTDLENDVMPVIRYSGLGDMASFKNYQKTLLNPIFGRKVDIVKSPKGRSIHPFKLTLEVQKVDGINMYQIQQKKINELDVLIIPKKDACHDTIRKEVDMYMKSALDDDMSINVRLVDMIPRKNKSHKHATVVSYLQ